MLFYIMAFLWGIAEATFFFFIPVIYLTRLAIFNYPKALKACFVAAIAACLGAKHKNINVNPSVYLVCYLCFIFL